MVFRPSAISTPYLDILNTITNTYPLPQHPKHHLLVIYALPQHPKHHLLVIYALPQHPKHHLLVIYALPQHSKHIPPCSHPLRQHSKHHLLDISRLNFIQELQNVSSTKPVQS